MWSLKQILSADHGWIHQKSGLKALYACNTWLGIYQATLVNHWNHLKSLSNDKKTTQNETGTMLCSKQICEQLWSFLEKNILTVAVL